MIGSDHEMLRHFLAALAYRTPKALRDAPTPSWLSGSFRELHRRRGRSHQRG